MCKQEAFNHFRNLYPRFVYEDFHYTVDEAGMHISFCFNALDANGTVAHTFRPQALIEARSFLNMEGLPEHTLDMLVFHIGMIELVSYWKCTCSPTVVVKPYRLDDQQVAFWKKLFFNGLGEFFYINGIDTDVQHFMSLSSDTSTTLSSIPSPFVAPAPDGDNHIVPIGGGKDSVVSLEILGGGRSTANGERSQAQRPLPLIMNPRGATVECVRQAGYSLDDVIVIKRSIDKHLLELNAQGFLNGHTPFSAMLAFYTLLASALTGVRCRIALSNENSANESTVKDSSVNHQYSKSLEFENDFRHYVAQNISPEFNYYSFLRPLSELQIAMLFAHYPHYFDVFKSCNAGSKQDIWCGKCAKCLFAYIILSPFIEPKRLDAIFGHNLLDDESLRPFFNELRGLTESKPFECVGTVDEVNSALNITFFKWYADTSSRPLLLRDFSPSRVTTPLDTISTDHNLLADDLERLQSTLHGGAWVEQLYRYKDLFNMLAGQDILIAGYGREGKSSFALLQRLFPSRRFDIAQNNDEIAAALANKHYDLILKSPGIPTFLFDGLCDSAAISSLTDIFLRLYGDHTVGVTGTKGKSTTTAMIFNVLKSAGLKCLMAGNMGLPLFDILDKMDADTWVAAELSCHQLENIRRAPAVAVLLNLYQEHLDHYRNYDGYCMAKMQIALRQQPDDVFVCNSQDDAGSYLQRYRHDIKSSVLTFSQTEALQCTPLRRIQLPVVGDHNVMNAYVAWLVADYMRLPQASTAQALAHFKGLEHRLERVAEKEGVIYYNDSISTIPQTTIAAVEALREVDSLILGGFDRGIDYTPLADALLNPDSPCFRISTLVLLGSAGKAIADLYNRKAHTASPAPPTRNILSHFDKDYSMEEAVLFCAAHTAKGKICLLSPAASSYDHYQNFEYRGADFKHFVAALPSSSPS